MVLSCPERLSYNYAAGFDSRANTKIKHSIASDKNYTEIPDTSPPR